MYITVSGSTFTRLKSLSFAPQTDLTGQSVPINEFSVDVVTEENQDVEIGDAVALYDDLDTLWASYTVSYAERIDRRTLRIQARSLIAMLDADIMPPVMYTGEALSSVLTAVFSNAGTSVGYTPYVVDSYFSTARINGFCPEQSARERLLWVCFVIGAYVKTYFGDKVEIKRIPTTDVTVPPGDTFFKPTVTYNDWVTEVRLKWYSYEIGEPQTKDKWVEANDVTYIETEHTLSLSNPDAPAAAPKNVVSIEGVKLVTSAVVAADILSYLAKWHFRRTQVELDCINNATFMPGQLANVSTDEDALYKGYIESATFAFGLQARATLHLTATVDVASSGLTILYYYNTMQIGRAVYRFPVGFVYNVPNPYIDQNLEMHRYVYRPLNAAAEGTMPAANTTRTENYAVALDHDINTRILHVISVDGVEDDGEGVIEIA